MSEIASSLQYSLRPVAAHDREGVIALIDGVYREYGDIVCLEGAESDLTVLPESYTERGGEFVVLEADDTKTIVGAHAVVPIPDKPGVCTFRRLYLAPELRGGEWGQRLMAWAVERAEALGFQRIEFWSDRRFTRAHRFFERWGFQKTGEIRTMHDGVVPYDEFFFFADLPLGENG